MADHYQVSLDWHEDGGDQLYVSLYDEEVPAELRRAADVALGMVALDLHIRPELIWVKREKGLVSQWRRPASGRPRLAFRTRSLRGLAHVEQEAFMVVVDPHTEPADVVEVVCHECAHLAHAGEDEARRIGRIHRAAYGAALRKLRTLEKGETLLMLREDDQ
jgi:hypothetical protein